MSVLLDIAGAGGGPVRWAGRLRALGAVAALLAAWELAARLKFAPPLFLPPATTVLATLVDLIRDGALPLDLALSLYRAFAGLALASLAGVALGLAMARSGALRWLCDPLVALGFPAPKIAFIPVFILWFGIDSTAKILLVAFACVFQMAIATFHAAGAVDRAVIWSAQALGSSPVRLMVSVMLPACCPRIFSALRVAVPVALITTFTCEMVAGGGGMGASLMYAQRLFESPTVYAYIAAMMAVGLILDAALVALQARHPLLRGDAP